MKCEHVGYVTDCHFTVLTDRPGQYLLRVRARCPTCGSDFVFQQDDEAGPLVHPNDDTTITIPMIARRKFHAS